MHLFNKGIRMNTSLKLIITPQTENETKKIEELRIFLTVKCLLKKDRSIHLVPSI